MGATEEFDAMCMALTDGTLRVDPTVPDGVQCTLEEVEARLLRIATLGVYVNNTIYANLLGMKSAMERIRGILE